MNDSEVREILDRAGIAAEGALKVRQLDKFENTVVDIALRLVDEDDDLDPAMAGMDILDAVNDKMMTESWSRRAGTWYDPYQRALELLQENMDEDAFQDMRARMAAQADQYLKGRDSSMQHAELEPEEEPPQAATALGQAAQQLDQIRRKAIRDNYQLDRESINALAKLIKDLQQHDQMAAQSGGKLGMRLKRLFSSLGLAEGQKQNRFINQRVLNEMCDACAAGMECEGGGGMVEPGMPEGPAAIIAGAVNDVRGALRELRMLLDAGMTDDIDDRLDSIMHHIEDIGEQVAGYEGMEVDEDIAELRRRAGIVEEEEQHDLYTMLNTQRHILGSVIPEIRGIAIHFVNDANAKQRLSEIADQLASLQWKIHGERERGFGQMWTDVERRDPLWKGRV